MIDRLVDAGAPVDTCCRMLGVSRQGYYRYRKRPTSATELRRRWLIGLIREIHVASRGTYGYRRIHAELTIGMSIPCSSRLVSVLMTRAGIGGLPGPARIERLKGVATADDLLHRKFHRLTLNELSVTDVTEHPTREGKIYCAAVLDACSRKIIDWAIDSKQDSTLVVNTLDMAIRTRQPGPGGVVHADHGVQGEFNRSSQHLDYGGVQGWRLRTGAGRRAMSRRVRVGSGVLTGPCDPRCVHRAGLSRPERYSGSFGG